MFALIWDLDALFLRPIRHSRPIRFFFGTDLDRVLPFNHDKASHSTFLSLLTAQFTVTTLLGITTQGKGKDISLLLTIYLFLSSLIVSGIVLLLRSRQSTSAGIIRAYDEPSIIFGRWVLTMACTLIVLISSLAYFEAIPGQQPERKVYTKARIDTTTSLINQKFPANSSTSDPKYRQDELRMREWLKLIAAGAQKTDAVYKNRYLLWIEQPVPFDDAYQDIEAEIKFCESYSYIQATAFLVTDGDAGQYRPIYRQLRFESTSDTLRETPHFSIPNPNPGERLIILLRLSLPELAQDPKKDAAAKPACQLPPTKPDDFSVSIHVLLKDNHR